MLPEAISSLELHAWPAAADCTSSAAQAAALTSFANGNKPSKSWESSKESK